MLQSLPFAQTMTGASGRNVSKLFSEFKLVRDNLIYIYKKNVANTSPLEKCCLGSQLYDSCICSWRLDVLHICVGLHLTPMC